MITYHKFGMNVTKVRKWTTTTFQKNKCTYQKKSKKSSWKSKERIKYFCFLLKTNLIFFSLYPPPMSSGLFSVDSVEVIHFFIFNLGPLECGFSACFGSQFGQLLSHSLIQIIIDFCHFPELLCHHAPFNCSCYSA